MSPNLSPEKTQDLSSLTDEEIAGLLDVPERELAGGRAIMETVRGLQRAYAEARTQFRLNQQKIADRLDVVRSVVNKRLLGRENMTIRTLAELAWAMGYRLRIEFERDPDQVPEAGNWFSASKQQLALSGSQAGLSYANNAFQTSAGEALAGASKQLQPPALAVQAAN